VRKIHIALAVALAAGALACGSGGDGDDDVTDIPAAQDQPAKPAKVAGLNQPVRDGKFEFVVTKWDCSKSRVGQGALGQDAQGKFCLMTVKVRNVGKQAQLFDASSQKAFDAAGITYDADTGASPYVNKNVETFLNNINPGNSVTGVIPFDVPKKSTITSVELHDSAFSGGVGVKVG
jgi:uncharacterized protein DUF4352